MSGKYSRKFHNWFVTATIFIYRGQQGSFSGREKKVFPPLKLC